MSSGRSTRRVARHTGNKKKTRRNKRRFDFKRLIAPLVVLIVSAGICYGVAQLLTTPSLEIKRIEVKGTRLLSVNDVRADASVAIGQNVLTLSKKTIAKKILKRPEVLDVSVGRRLPRTAVLTVTERTAFVTVSNGSGFWLVDRTGLPFHRVGAPLKTVPLVVLTPGVKVVSGKKVVNGGLPSAMKCVQSCPSLVGRITKISVDRAGNVCLNIGSDFYVKLGQPVEIREKMTKLSDILAAQPEIGERVEYINVSCYQAPALKMKPASLQKPAENT